MKWIWIFICFLCVNSQKGVELKTDTTYTKAFPKGGSEVYYLVIPDNVKANTEFLIFDVYPADNDDSDPNIFMSDVTLILL